ncbi:hypothetical protein BN1708_000926 [Verticillium longisporum]|uniref:Uncharacterized protein n=1 Tax=Verticillium longisporum TaxID=100787 RepID=A0A0G4M8E9_VERLO|nr:hypothetical protein BN1708_000926 [Verticillium longisporum]
MTETLSGLKLIALCACLAEVHRESMPARILSALWKVYGFSEEYKPSLEQFSSLVKVCSGVLSASPFPEVHRRMMDLDLPIASPEGEGQERSEPADVAKALRGVFDITTEKHNRITVVGGSSCSFVAAISHWLFDLTTYVEDENGKVLFAPSIGECPIDPITAKVHVQYGSATTASMIDISSTSYGIGNIRDIIALDDERSLTLRSRVPWDLALSLVFGGIFLKLMKAPKLLGSLLGSIARVTLALAVGERDVGDCDRGDFIDFTEASYGHGFINSVSQTFPELSSSELRQHMEDAAATTFKVAYGQIQTDLDMLQYHSSKPRPVNLITMGGLNLEVFKFGMYLMFPIGIMYYFGTNLDERFAVAGYWPKAENSHKIPFERDEIKEEYKRLMQRQRYLEDLRRKREEREGVSRQQQDES